MANGFLPGILLSSKQVFDGIINPQFKITPMGYLNMLLANGLPSVVSAGVENNGHLRNVTIKYRNRAVAGTSITTDDCTVQATDPWKEVAIPTIGLRHKAVFIDYDEIRKYELEASQTVMVGRPMPPMGIMNELYGRVIENANALLQDVNSDLLTQQAASFGKNATTGLATVKTVNFPLSTQSNPLGQGWTMLMQDVMENEIRPDNIVIVGSGLIQGVKMQIQNNTQNTTQQNYPTGIAPILWDWNTTSKWGANQFGVFEKGSVQFININKWGGNFGGDKLSSWLGTINLPLVDSLGNSLSSFKFDFQLRHIDCPQTLTIGGVDTPVKRGWIFDLFANYAQFNIPSDAYNAADRLTGNNGTLRYVATNA